MSRWLLCLAIAVAGTTAQADDGRLPIVGFRVRGPSKVTDRTLGYLARVELGDPIGQADVATVTQHLVSSELFEQVSVALEETTGGYLVVATLDDKHSWIVAPTVYVLPGKRAVGVGFAENNLAGQNQKLLLY